MKKLFIILIIFTIFTQDIFSQSTRTSSYSDSSRSLNTGDDNTTLTVAASNPFEINTNTTTNRMEKTPFSNFNILGESINRSFYFVLDIIIKMREDFMSMAFYLGRIVFLIALCLAALNYALTGQGFKENMIKIGKAVVFFIIVMVGYPAIITWISDITFQMSYKAVGSDVSTYFKGNVTQLTEQTLSFGDVVRQQNFDISAFVNNTKGALASDMKRNNTWNNMPLTSTNQNYNLFSRIIAEDTGIARDPDNIFGQLIRRHNNYSVMQPGALIKIIFLVAGECFRYAETSQSSNGWFNIAMNIANCIKGLIMAFIVILTGIFATIEYIICFLEFMLVTSVGIILFPFSIWEGSKFAAESFIKCILGFTLKLLFINIAIFLMCYGYINIFSQFQETIMLNKQINLDTGMIIFCIFSSILFYIICKSAPGIAQGLLTGTPSLSASGAIAAVTGAVGAAVAVKNMATAPIKGVASAAAGAGGAITSAKAAGAAAKENGGSAFGGVIKSLGVSAGNQLMRSLTGNKNQSVEQMHNQAKQSGYHRGAGFIPDRDHLTNPNKNYAKQNNLNENGN